MKTADDNKKRARMAEVFAQAVREGVLDERDVERHYSEDLIELYNDCEGELTRIVILAFLAEWGRSQYATFEGTLFEAAYPVFQLGYYFGQMEHDDA